MTHHAEWLSLLDVSGPFVSIPVLERVFPQGLDQVDSDHRAKLLLAYDEWAEEQQKPEPDPEIHAAWIRLVFTETLGFTPEVLAEGDSIPDGVEVRIPESSDTDRPDVAVLDPETDDARMLISVWPAGTPLDETAGAAWAASPIDRMIALCRADGVEVRLGLVTNGERWVLVDAPVGETSAHASWYAGLWQQEPLTLRGFYSLLCLRRFFGVAEEDRLDAMLQESAEHQADVTDKLGLQVRQAVEVLVAAIDRADIDSGRSLLADVEPARVYEAALTVMMRLVFLFSAEERGLLLLGENEFYDQSYAVSTLSAQLREAADQVGEAVLENRQDAWLRLLSTFRAIHSGVHHEGLQIIPYGSSLFDPDRFPFLEGRASDSSWRDEGAKPVPVDNRTVLLLLESLQTLDFGSSGRRRLSFRALDIEQIGHVYETLLDHTAVRATETMVSLQGNQNQEPEIPVETLHALVVDGDEDALVEFLRTELKKSESATRTAFAAKIDPEVTSALERACRGDQTLLAKLLPLHGFIRRDPWGRPVVIHEGSVFVTEGEDRRSTGTHYTPRYLTELVVRHTLDPVVYEGPSDGVPEDEWRLRSAEEILDLHVCDPAMGSGAFLVAAIRFLSERLLEAWDDEGVDGLPSDLGERAALARLAVAEHCVYGVDINPMAVELAKLSIWLVTLARGRAFTFLDHALKCGDSLLGLHDLDQIRKLHIDPTRGVDLHFTLFDPTEVVEAAIDTAARLRHEISEIETRDIFDAVAKERLHREAEHAVGRLQLVADALVGAALLSGSDSELDGSIQAIGEKAGEFLDGDELAGQALRIAAAERLDADVSEDGASRHPFHWPVEFPEVASAAGFDAIVTNPPFMGGQKITGALGSHYRQYLVKFIARGRTGSADLCAYFLLRSVDHLLAKPGFLGALATNSVSEGQTRQVGLAPMLESGATLIRANRSQAWPGDANLAISLLWLSRGAWEGRRRLDGRPVVAIDPGLREASIVAGEPVRLVANLGRAFQGMILRGTGFQLDPQDAGTLIDAAVDRAAVIKPFLRGSDVVDDPHATPSTWVIDFTEMDLQEAERRFPELLGIVRDRVKPTRDRLKMNDPGRTAWWQFGATRPRLREAIVSLTDVTVVTLHAKHLAFRIVPAGQVFSHGLAVIASNSLAELGILSCEAHRIWAAQWGSSLGTALRYTISGCFETYPQPAWSEEIENRGRQYRDARLGAMVSRGIGLTDFYNLVHDRREKAADIAAFRRVAEQLEATVLAAFGWPDVDCEFAFRDHEGLVRFGLGHEPAREVLSRLYAMNAERGSGQ